MCSRRGRGRRLPRRTGEHAARLRGARILLTEDNEINQQIAVELLEGAGATVKVANNGREAVDILSSGPQPPPFDLVLMDLQMPEMDGYQATAKLRSDARFATLPIIAMTAHATIEERQRCLAAGMNDHVSKPIDPENLFGPSGASAAPRGPRSTRRRGADPCRHAPDGGSRRTAGGRAPRPCRPSPGSTPPDGLRPRSRQSEALSASCSASSRSSRVRAGRIARALERGDATVAERAAHTLKGVAGKLGAPTCRQAAGKLEKAIAHPERRRAGRSPSSTSWRATLDRLLCASGRRRCPAPEAARQPPPRPSRRRSSGSVQEIGPTPRHLRSRGRRVPGGPPRTSFALCSRRRGVPGFKEQVEGFALADALAALRQAAREKGIPTT